MVATTPTFHYRRAPGINKVPEHRHTQCIIRGITYIKTAGRKGGKHGAEVREEREGKHLFQRLLGNRDGESAVGVHGPQEVSREKKKKTIWT